MTARLRETYNNEVFNALKEKYHQMSDDELKHKHLELKERAKKESLDSLLVEAFALVREATRRTLNKEHYDVQLLAGITLHKGRIAEAKTGGIQTFGFFTIFGI